MKKYGDLLVFPLLPVILAGIDLFTKSRIKKRHPEKAVFNKGFAHNVMDNKSSLVAAISASLTAALIYKLCRFRGGGWAGRVKKLGMAFILGGSAGNTWERVKNRRVTDFIHIGKYVYNAADLFIYAGTVMAVCGEVLDGDNTFRL